MHTTNIVAIVFRLINFGAFIALAVYLFKNYALSGITLQISKRQQKLADLALQNQRLKEQTKTTESSIANEQTVSHGLLQKIDLWKTLVSQHMLERDQEKESRESALVNKVKHQQTYIELRDAQKKALLPAIEKAREALMVNYTAQPLGQSFINTIVKHMEKS